MWGRGSIGLLLKFMSVVDGVTRAQMGSKRAKSNENWQDRKRVEIEIMERHSVDCGCLLFS